jgi:hypothetical protein
MKISSYRINIRPEVTILALLNVLLHLMFYSNLEYHRDELLYFALGLHPSFGYETVPPLIGWIAWLMEHIFGYGLFSVKIFPALMSGAMVVLCAAIAKELGGKLYAEMLAGFGIMISIFGMRAFSLYQPVHLDIFFWTLSLYFIIKYINSDSGKYLFLFGLFAGFSLLNKYLIGLLFIILLLVIPFTSYRNVFGKRMFWIGLAAGAVLFLPNLLWQILHGLPVVNHMSELNSSQLSHTVRLDFLKDQLISPGASSFLSAGGFIFILTSRKVSKYRFLVYTSALVILSLLLLRGKSYYTLGVYPFLISAGAVSFELLYKRWYVKLLFPLVLVFLTLAILPFGLPVYKAQGLKNYFDRVENKYGIDVGRTFEDGSKHSLPQDYSDMLGWEELTSITAKAYGMVDDKKACLIYGENYGQASAVTIIGKKYKLPEAISFNESFIYWFPRKFDPDITSLIYINDEPGKDISLLFKKITVVGKISDPDAREYGTTVYLCQEPYMSFTSFWAERVGKFLK